MNIRHLRKIYKITFALNFDLRASSNIFSSNFLGWFEQDLWASDNCRIGLGLTLNISGR